jgi:type IV secretory pathway VirB2 component (pilin)
MFKKILILTSCFFFSLNLAFGAVELSEEQPTTQPQNNAKTIQKAATGELSSRISLAEKNPVAALLCKVIRAFTGTIAKIIAVLMVIGLAISLFAANIQHPVNPVTVVSVIIGVGLLFSADYVVGKIIGEAAKGGTASQACDCKYGVDCIADV